MAYQAPTSLPQFDIQRKQAQQRLGAQAQQQNEAMQRRFAAQGGLNSGAAIKQQQLLGEQQARQSEDTLGQIGAQEAGELQRQKEVAQGQEFQAGENAKTRALQEAAQKAQNEQFAKQFGLSGQQFAEAQKQGAFERRMAEKQGALQERQFSAERVDQAFNKAISQSQLKGGQYNRFLELTGGRGMIQNPNPQTRSYAPFVNMQNPNLPQSSTRNRLR